MIDLSTLAPEQGVIVQGADPGDYAGNSVSDAGDVNGDGFADFIVGAPFSDAAGTDAGAAYVIFGHAGGFSDIDLSNLTVGDGFVIVGDAAGDNAGKNVSGAGDVNGDGFDDLMVGAWFGDDGGIDAGEAYVIFGHAGEFSDIDLSNLTSDLGFTIQGDDAGDRTGARVSGAGDLNGDGFAELVVSAWTGDDGGTDAGEVYVIFGHAGDFAAIDLTVLSPTDGFIIQGDDARDYAGRSISSAGDVNGDGFADLILGAWFGNDGGANAGEAYVVFGRDGGFGTVDGTGRSVLDLTGLASADGFVIQGDAAGDRAGGGVSGAGDINGDGYADLVVGAPFGDDGGTDSGEVYVIFGHAGGFADIDLSSLSADQGFIIRGDAAGDRVAGGGVSGAGDVNGDGFADLILGAPFGDDGGTDAGEAYVIFGRADGFADIDLSSLSPEEGFIIQGDSAGDRAGGSVSGAGDINGDGFADLILGARLGDDGGATSGEAYVIFGMPPTEAVTRIGTVASQALSGGAFADVLSGLGGDDVLRGNAGDDVLDGGKGSDTMYGGAGGDRYFVDDTGDLVIEAALGGDDRVNAAIDYVLPGDVEILDLRGTAVTGRGNGLDNAMIGSSGKNKLLGRGGDDIIDGGAGYDTLVGGNGDDQLAGGRGRDTLTGGAGADRFVFRDADALTAEWGAADIVIDFDQGTDRIKLKEIDADATIAGDQAFAFINSAAFSGVAGQLRFAQSAGHTFIEGDTDGDGAADLVIRLSGLVYLTSGDFAL